MTFRCSTTGVLDTAVGFRCGVAVLLAFVFLPGVGACGGPGEKFRRDEGRSVNLAASDADAEKTDVQNLAAHDAQVTSRAEAWDAAAPRTAASVRPDADASGETERSSVILDASLAPQGRDASDRAVDEDTSIAESDPQNASGSRQHDAGTSATEDRTQASTDAGRRSARRGLGEVRGVERDAGGEITCESACGAAGAECHDNVCVFTCAAGECADDIQCPDDFDCRVQCSDAACQGGIVCPERAACAIQCDGERSCAGPVECQGSACSLDCAGERSCAGGVSGGATDYNVNCTGARSCAAGISCGASTCNINCSGSDSCAGPMTTGANQVNINCTNASCRDIVCSASVCAINCSEDSCTSVECHASSTHGACWL